MDEERHLPVDSGGRLWAAGVSAADKADGYGGCHLIVEKKQWQTRLETIVGDGAYGGVFAKKAAGKGFVFERASRPENSRGFVPVAKRRVVERTIARTNFFRRLVKDYDYTVQSSVAWLFLADSTGYTGYCQRKFQPLASDSRLAAALPDAMRTGMVIGSS